MEQKKILHIVTHFHPFLGGLENMVLPLATEQATKHDVSILTLRYDKKLPEFEELDGGLKIHRLPSLELIKNQYSVPKFGFGKKVRSLNPDIIFTHTRFFMASFLGGWNKPQNAKWIHVEHGQNFVKSKNPVIAMGAWFFDQTFGRYIFKKSGKVVVLSQEGQKFVRQISDRKNGIIVIPNGVKIPQEIKAAPRKNKAIFFGRLIPEKGIAEVTKAAKNCPSWSFDIYGEGDHNYELRIKNDELKNVKFYGLVSPKIISEEIQNSDLVILPSWSEGNSLAILEAAANSRPILATPVGQNEKIVANKFLVPVKNSAKIVAKLNQLENDFKVLEAEGAKNSKKVKQLYSFKKMIDAYESLLNF